MNAWTKGDKSPKRVIHAADCLADTLRQKDSGVGAAQDNTAHDEHTNSSVDDELFDVPVVFEIGAFSDKMGVNIKPQIGY